MIPDQHYPREPEEESSEAVAVIAVCLAALVCIALIFVMYVWAANNGVVLSDPPPECRVVTTT